MSNDRVQSGTHMIVGIAVIVLGVLLMLYELDIPTFAHLYKFWPLILIAIGLGKLFLGRTVPKSGQENAGARAGSGGRRTRTSADDSFVGVVLIIVGVYLQLATLGYGRLRWNYVWPLLVIIAGVGIIYWSLQEHRGPNASPGAEINHVNFFGGGDFRVASRNFRGGKLINIFAGFKADLTEADFEGEETVIDVISFCGGGEIRVPRDWVVSVRGAALFGGCNDDRPRLPPEAGRAKKTLVITGVWIFGGLNIRN